METLKKLFLLFFLMSISSGYAIQYCDHPMTSSNGRSITISFEQPSTNNYKITVKSAVNMTGIHDGWFMTINGSNNVQVKNYAVLSGDSKTITINFTSTSTPVLYTQIHVLFPPTTGADLALYPVPFKHYLGNLCGERRPTSNFRLIYHSYQSAWGCDFYHSYGNNQQ
ncbi:hypothetical protein [Flavobacterium sp.]|uniref:hypothetical protein n=1 Tax=Flavobacterium sp. TaxID=239 RepID=UPI0039E6141D